MSPFEQSSVTTDALNDMKLDESALMHSASSPSAQHGVWKTNHLAPKSVCKTRTEFVTFVTLEEGAEAMQATQPLKTNRAGCHQRMLALMEE